MTRDLAFLKVSELLSLISSRGQQSLIKMETEKKASSVEKKSAICWSE